MAESVEFSVDISGLAYDFSGTTFEFDESDKGEGRISKMVRSREEYSNWQFYILVLSASILLTLVLKQLFNVCGTKRSKIAIDKWTLLDCLNAGLNIFAY